jgi:hypothetical protein
MPFRIASQIQQKKWMGDGLHRSLSVNDLK